MNAIIFRDPNGDKSIIKNSDALRELMIEQFETYWMQGSGDGFFEFYEEDRKLSTLMVGPNIQYGLYLHYIDNFKKIDLLSLNDKEKLNEVAETAEEIYASVGLFLPKEKAWDVILDYMKDGKPSDKIVWITPADIPEYGNW